MTTSKIKYVVTYELEVYASSPSEAMKSASGHVVEVAGRMLTAFPDRVWDETKELPTGTLTGAPHTTGELDGWRCFTSLGLKED
jgi:hypothetical protein